MSKKNTKNYYNILGVSKDASLDDIKKAFKNLAKKYHPDKTGEDKDSEEKFKEISEAYENLADPQKRSRYDSIRSPRKFPHFKGGFDPFAGDFDPFDDLRKFSGFGRQKNAKEELTAYVNIEIDLEKICSGTEENIFYDRWFCCDECNGKKTLNKNSIIMCRECNGRGQILMMNGPLTIFSTCPRCYGKCEIISDPCKKCNGKGFFVKKQELKNIKIPKGISENNVIKIDKMGHYNENGLCGDLIIQISYKDHPVFKKSLGKMVARDCDVFFECFVPLHVAILGGKIKIPTLQGPCDLEIQSGLKHGSIFILKNKGLYKINRGVSDSFGDQINILNIENPKNISDKLKEALLDIKEEEYINYTEKVNKKANKI